MLPVYPRDLESKKVYLYLKSGGPADSQTISDYLNMDLRTVVGHLRKLNNAGYIAKKTKPYKNKPITWEAIR